MTVLEVLIAFFLPSVSVAMKKGLSSKVPDRAAAPVVRSHPRRHPRHLRRHSALRDPILQSQVDEGDAGDLVPLRLDEPVTNCEGEPIDVGGEHDSVDLLGPACTGLVHDGL